MLLRSFVAVVVAGALALPAHADPILNGNAVQSGIGIEVGAIVHSGMSEYGDDYSNLAPDVQGIVIRDRNGMSSRMVIGLLIAIAGAMAASGPKSVESRSYRSGNYIVTETKTTYYSEAEKQQMRENTSKSIDGLFAARYSDFELHLFSRDRFERGQASGYKVNFLAGDGSKTFGFETGFGFGEVDSIVDDAGMPTRIKWKYFGMPFRLTGVAGKVLRWSLSYEWNWLKYGLSDEERRVRTVDNNGVMSREVSTGSHPWKLDVSTMLLGRIALTGGVTAQTLKLELGYYASAGIFF